MECRANCGACCIAISISSPIPGMPHGKPAGMPCIHLTDTYQCTIFGSADRPQVCKGFMAEKSFCGNSQSEAMEILTNLEYGEIEGYR